MKSWNHTLSQTWMHRIILLVKYEIMESYSQSNKKAWNHTSTLSQIWNHGIILLVKHESIESYSKSNMKSLNHTLSQTWKHRIILLVKYESIESYSYSNAPSVPKYKAPRDPVRFIYTLHTLHNIVHLIFIFSRILFSSCKNPPANLLVVPYILEQREYESIESNS